MCSALKEIDVVNNILDVKENMFGMCSMSQWLTEYFSLAVSLRNFFFPLRLMSLAAQFLTVLKASALNCVFLKCCRTVLTQLCTCMDTHAVTG